jgi:hypothetical protein
LALTHIMHAPHKACNFRFTESKGRGENKKWEIHRVKGEERYAESKESGGGVNVTLGLENILFILAFFF